MATDYSVEVCRGLEQRFRDVAVHRPMRIRRYEPGTELSYKVQDVASPNKADVHLVVEKFIGGGFAGQVYRVKILEIEPTEPVIVPLQVGQVYAMKILIPPSGFSRLFRNVLYRLGFQGPFQLQVNPSAARAGALWQKFIRRAAKIRLGDERSVADIYATFVDTSLGSCGELSEWIDGRTWRLEADDRLDLLKQWTKGHDVDTEKPASPEYRAKRRFMADFVELLHDVGAYELARQYEWNTCKSQPNCLKRAETEEDPSGGLTAVDFRAGLVLLPFLPMSPGDFMLIGKGIARGSLVQFDRGSVAKLDAFVQAHADDFADMGEMLTELKAAERVYRDSVPDVTHNHIRLLYSNSLWLTMMQSAVKGWQVRNIVDDSAAARFRQNKILLILFAALGLAPFLGGFVRRIWGHADWRRHYREILTSQNYLRRAVRARMAEKLITWHRAGRVSAPCTMRLAENFWRFLGHLPLSVLPAWLHRFWTDWQYVKERLAFFIVRPVRLYFNAELREKWLADMVNEGQRNHMLTDEDAKVILSHLKEPFIQKYLISLVVHLLTLPVTQIVSVTIATIYWFTHRGQPNAWTIGIGIIAFFQVFPISPGSLVRGFYVLYLVIRERNFKDYNIAVFLAFFKYIGYLAFPIQMTYHYPTLARFMAAHWATGAVHIIPVFGERGALLEHGVFCLFYNRPLTIRRRIRMRAERRSKLQPRYWHVAFCAIGAAAILWLADTVYLRLEGTLPGLGDIWWLAALVPLVAGSVVTLAAGGAALPRRIVSAAGCGALVGILYTIFSAVSDTTAATGGAIALRLLWQVFIFAICSTIGAIFTELKLPER